MRAIEATWINRTPKVYSDVFVIDCAEKVRQLNLLTVVDKLPDDIPQQVIT